MSASDIQSQASSGLHCTPAHFGSLRMYEPTADQFVLLAGDQSVVGVTLQALAYYYITMYPTPSPTPLDRPSLPKQVPKHWSDLNSSREFS